MNVTFKIISMVNLSPIGDDHTSKVHSKEIMEEKFGANMRGTLKSLMRSFILLSTILLLQACASYGPTRSIDDPSSSLVFAFINMENAPTSVSYADLHQVAPKAETGYWGMSEEDGLLYNQYLPNGSYQISHFGGSSFMTGEYRYSFPAYGRNETALRIEKPGIYFMGSYAYQEVDTGFFEQGKFDMKPIESPDEKALLKKLLKLDWVKGTQWEARIQSKLSELSK